MTRRDRIIFSSSRKQQNAACSNTLALKSLHSERMKWILIIINGQLTCRLEKQNSSNHGQTSIYKYVSPVEKCCSSHITYRYFFQVNVLEYCFKEFCFKEKPDVLLPGNLNCSGFQRVNKSWFWLLFLYGTDWNTNWNNILRLGNCQKQHFQVSNFPYLLVINKGFEMGIFYFNILYIFNVLNIGGFSCRVSKQVHLEVSVPFVHLFWL